MYNTIFYEEKLGCALKRLTESKNQEAQPRGDVLIMCYKVNHV